MSNSFIDYMSVLDDSVIIKVIFDDNEEYNYEDLFSVYEFKNVMKITQPSLYDFLSDLSISVMYPDGDIQVIHLKNE